MALPSYLTYLWALSICVSLAAAADPRITAYYPLDGSYENDGGVWSITEGTAVTLSLIGSDFMAADHLFFTESGSDCLDRLYNSELMMITTNGTEALVTVMPEAPGLFSLCIEDTHQGPIQVNVVTAPSDVIPLWASCILLAILLILSGLFSGLNLGLMSLDPHDLKLLADSGDEKESKYARAILPLRRKGNLLLCTVLLGNVLVNSTLTILLDGIAGGLGAVLGSTAGIVIFGEIVPQSVCSRHALAVGAHTIWITKFFLAVTFPLAYPISVILDYVLGDEVGSVYTSKQLLQLLELQDPYNDLAKDEYGIIRGALTYRAKTAREIMTSIDDVFMLDINAILDFKTVTRIIDSGHSRIPTYRDSYENIVGLLYVKDLAFIDPDDKTPLESVIKYYKHPTEVVDADDKLDELLDLFKQGRTHMALVMEIDNSTELDPLPKLIGIATLEDVIEEIIQDEIIDETDRVVDNKTKQIVARESKLGILPPEIFEKITEQENVLSEQVAHAVFSFLSTAVDAFAPTVIDPTVLRKLISIPACIRKIDADSAVDNDDEQPTGSDQDGDGDDAFGTTSTSTRRRGRKPSEGGAVERQTVLYKRGEKYATFTLVLEGTVRIVAGNEGFVINGGPFHMMGVNALQQGEFVADFSATVTSHSALLLEIPHNLYMDALNATKRKGLGEATPKLRRRIVGGAKADSQALPTQTNASTPAPASPPADNTDKEGKADKEDKAGNAEHAIIDFSAPSTTPAQQEEKKITVVNAAYADSEPDEDDNTSLI